MIRLITTALVMSAVFSTNCFAISRVGNASIGDDELGFEAPVPSKIEGTSELPDDSLRLYTSTVSFTLGASFTVQSIDVIPLARQLPDLAFLSRTEFDSRLENAGWQKFSLHDSCVSAWTKDSENLQTLVANWGEGKGVTIVSPLIRSVSQIAQQLAQGLRLKEGACRW